MLQFLLMLLGLVFPNNNTTVSKSNDDSKANQTNIQIQENTSDSVGETIQIPPKKNN